jgi:hypothetical protein
MWPSRDPIEEHLPFRIAAADRLVHFMKRKQWAGGMKIFDELKE